MNFTRNRSTGLRRHPVGSVTPPGGQFVLVSLQISVPLPRGLFVCLFPYAMLSENLCLFLALLQPPTSSCSQTTACVGVPECTTLSAVVWCAVLSLGAQPVVLSQQVEPDSVAKYSRLEYWHMHCAVEPIPVGWWCIVLSVWGGGLCCGAVDWGRVMYCAVHKLWHMVWCWLLQMGCGVWCCQQFTCEWGVAYCAVSWGGGVSCWL